ncbi:unnamed protein product [Oikopleura dioica]|nr:unnamed protein product [Oikopleura dioica]
MLDAEFDRKHKLNWKFNSVLLIVFIRGIQTLIFASLGDPKLQLIPCVAPLNQGCKSPHLNHLTSVPPRFFDG